MKFAPFVFAVSLGMLPHSLLQAADLMGIYQEALAQDAQFKSARAAFEAVQEKIPQGRAGFLPNITLSGTRQVQEVDAGKIVNSTTGLAVNPGANIIQSGGITISATQPIFRMQNIVIYQQAKTEVNKAESQFITAGQDLILRVAQAYFDVLDAQIDVEVNEAQKKAILVQLEQAKRNFEVGVSTIVDTNEAQARYDLTLSQEIAARNALEIKKRALQGIIDRLPENLTGAREIANNLATLKYGSMDEWVRAAEEKNFTLKAQQAAYESAHQNVKKSGRNITRPSIWSRNTAIKSASAPRLPGAVSISPRNPSVCSSTYRYSRVFPCNPKCARQWRCKTRLCTIWKPPAVTSRYRRASSI